MSCEIKPVVTLDDLGDIQKWFGLPGDDWLKAVHLSLSPTGELLALAHGNKLALISSQNYDQHDKYTHKKCNLDCNEIVTAVLCIPIVAVSLSVQSHPEWTCVAIGTASGKLMVFNSSGNRIFTKELHPEPIQSIKADTGKYKELHVFYMSVVCNLHGYSFINFIRNLEYTRTGSYDKLKALLKQHPDGEVPIYDEIRYQKWGYDEQYRTIRDAVVVGAQYRNTFSHLLMASTNDGFYAKYKNAPPQTSLVISVGERPFIGLHYSIPGALAPDITEMAKVAANKLKSTVSNWLTTGPSIVAPKVERKIPIVPMTLHSGLCDSQRTGVSIYLSPDKDLAAVTDTLGRVILIDCDKCVGVRIWKGYREAQCAFVKVNEKSSSSSSKSSSSSSSVSRRSNEQKISALFLVIFAPRLERLEIWGLQRGERVASFKAPQNGQLIYNNFSMMGTGGFNCAEKVKCSINYCIFLDPTSKQLKKIHIPFHFAVTDSNSKAAKDLYLLRRIKMCIRNMTAENSGDGRGGGGDDDNIDNDEALKEIQLFAKGFQTDKIRFGCIEMLIKNSKIQTNYFKIILDEIKSQLDDHKPDKEEEKPMAMSDDDRQLRKKLKQTIKHYRRLIDFYEYVIMESDLIITNLDKEDDREVNTADLESESETESPKLETNENCTTKGPDEELTPNSDENPIIWSDSELENFKTFIDLLQMKQQSATTTNRVTFDVNTKSEAFFEYLSVFNAITSVDQQSVDDDNDFDDNGDDYAAGNDDDDSSTDEKIYLNVKKTKLFAGVGSTIFSMFLEKGKSLDSFLQEAEKSHILGESLIQLFLSYWLDKSFSYTKIDDLMDHLTRFTSILDCICVLAKDSLFHLYNELSDWWQSVREILLESSNAIMSLLAAMLCRNYAFKFRQRENSTDDNSDEDLWETVSQESAQWTLLIAKLEDVAVLGVILKNCRPSVSHGEASAGTHSLISSYSPPNISLKSIITGGLGIVSKLVVNWILLFNIDPNILLEDDLVKKSGSTTSIVDIKTEESTVEKAIMDLNSVTFLKYFHILRKHFPFSLQSSILLTGMSWEYMRHWTKSDMHFLKITIKCLKTIRPDGYSLAHGICSMIWIKYLKIPLIGALKLIHKTGRLPKEILCLQNVGISDTIIPEFLDLSLEFLQYYRQTNNSKIPMKKPFIIRTEELLHAASDGGEFSLVQLAQNAPRAQDIILEILSQCCQVISIIAGLNMKYQTPISRLFDEMSINAIFSEVTEKLSYTLVVAHLELQKRRMGFLSQAITATMDLIVQESVDNIFLDEHEIWMGRFDELANIWNLHNDELKKHQVVELYAHGFDKYGCEQLERVLDTYSLGPPLLNIAGKRMNAFIRSVPNGYAEIAIVGTMITDFLDSLLSDDDRMTSDDISLDELMELCLKIFKCLSEKDSRNAKIAAQMCDACNILQIK